MKRTASKLADVAVSPSKLPRLDRQTIKIVSWNIENPSAYIDLQPNKVSSYFTKDKIMTKKKTIRSILEKHAFPDFLCLQEIRARQNDVDWISALRSSANSNVLTDDPLYDAHFSLCRSTKGQRRFGVVTYMKRSLAVERTREVDWDVEGRVSITEMSGWALINVYALNGSDYPWRNAQNEIKGTRSERKRAFNRLLSEECLRIKESGKAVVLIGDFNISLTGIECFPRLRTEEPHALARKEFNESFIPNTGVVDIFRKLHPHQKSYSWFSRTKPDRSDAARVDYALVDESLVDSVKRMEYLETPAWREDSDHCPLVLELELSKPSSRITADA